MRRRAAHFGVVAENHVILLLPTHPNAVPASALAEALNLPQVGEQLDRMCGSASIPARLLEQVPLPAVPPMLDLAPTQLG